MDFKASSKKNIEDFELPESGRSFFSVKVPEIGRAMLAQKKRIHSYILKGRRLRCEEPINIHFIANNEDVIEFLRDHERLDLSHYDDSLKSGGDGATFFITGEQDTLETQWEIFNEALGLRPELQRYMEQDSESNDYYDLIEEQAEMAIQEAIVEIYNRRENPTLLSRIKSLFGKTDPSNEVDIIREYGLVVTHIFVRDFLGLRIPGRTVYRQAQRFYLWIAIMFANLFVNPGGRNTILNIISTIVSKMYRRQILMSYKNPKQGTILHRLKRIGELKVRNENGALEKKYGNLDKPFEEYVVNILMEVAGSFQYLTGSSFGSIIKTIDEKENIGFCRNEIPTLIKKINKNPRAWIDEYLRHNSPTGFIFRKAKKPFVIDDTDILPGDMLCLITSEAAKDEDVFGPKETLLGPEKSKSLCPHHTHFGSPDTDPSNGKPDEPHHPCFGQYWGRTIIRNMLEGLLYFRWLQAAKGAKFKMQNKVFPSFKMTFAKEKNTQQFITILSEIPKENGNPKLAQQILNALGHHSGNAYHELGLSHLVHFMSGHVICGKENLPSKLPFNLRLPFIPRQEPDYLVIELSIDGNIEDLLQSSDTVFFDWIADLYQKSGITKEKLSTNEMRKKLFDDHVTLVQSIWPSLFHAKSTNGLPFSGTLGLNSTRIVAENDIATKAAKLVRYRGFEKKTFHGRLHVIRKLLKQEMIESATSNPGNWAWVLGGSKAPYFSETRDDSWVAKDRHENTSIMDYFGLARKLLPRILLVPVILLFGFLAAVFHDIPDIDQAGLHNYSAAKSFTFFMAAILLGGLVGMFGRRYGKIIDSELGEMFLVSSFYLGFLIFCNSWVNNKMDGERLPDDKIFNFWSYPGLGPIPDGIAFPSAIGILSLVISILYYLKLKLSQSKEIVLYKPHSKALGILILSLLVGATLYLHLFWMFPGELMDNGDYLVKNRFISGSLMDHIFYPIIHAGVIMLTVHAYRKSFIDPSCSLMNPLNSVVFLGFGGLIWVSTLFPIKSASYVIKLLRDISVFTFLIPLIIAAMLLIVFRFLNPATAARGSRKSNFVREVLGWGVLVSIFINMNSIIRDFWGNLFGITPLTGREIDSYIPQILTITKSFIIAFPITLVSTLVVVLLIQKFALATSEQNNTPHDSDPGFENMKNMMSRENAIGSDQNHMVSVQRLLPEWFRIRILLPLSFHVIRRMLTTGIIRPGFLGNVGTVHFARWVHLPRTRNYAFLSNYDGSFESYLEDFVTKVNAGLNAAWSHCVGFPKVKNIFLEGTQDGDRFKRWARGSTRPTPFWYSAYPKLTVEVIRRNALIRDGLVRARSASEAEAWFDLFNSTTRPEHALQTDQIQSFIFGSAGHLKSGCCLVIQSQTTEFGDISNLRKLLDRVQTQITFGQNKPKEHAVYFAISNAGIRNLSIDAADRDARIWQGDQSLNSVDETNPTWFSSPFVLGMDNDERAKVLGDFDDNNRLKWDWGSFENESKHELGVLLVYAVNDDIRDEIVKELNQKTDMTAISFHQITFKTHKDNEETDETSKTTKANKSVETESTKTNRKQNKLIKEPFGFVDGISNPIIRGTTRAAKSTNSIHLVNPGEFILGYRDNRGYFPPSPQVAASDDIHRLLPALPNQQPQKYPTFGESDADGLRDLGRNGSYLVIRQLEQDVDKFKKNTEHHAEDILQDLSYRTGENALTDWNNVLIMKSIIQAKMMGRWQDGQSLVTRPAYVNEFYNSLGLAAPTESKDEITKKFLHEDNEYLFGRDDPQGYACPFGSHVRRSNPRDSLDPNNPKELEVSNRHRLLRRGRSYKDEASNAEGTFFMCLNADIDRQFEFVQQSWINGRNFHGLRDEYDPISTNSGDFTIQCPGANYQFSIDKFVTVKGGGYFFMPSKDSLLYFMQTDIRSAAQFKDNPFNKSMATSPGPSGQES